MKITKKKVYLFLSAIILLLVGSYISLTPETYLEHFGINVKENVNFYSDLRAMGGMLLIFGLVSFAGAFSKKFEGLALTTTIAIFISYSVFRVTSFVLDGLPGNIILSAAGVEILFSLLGVYLLAKKNQGESKWKHQRMY